MSSLNIPYSWFHSISYDDGKANIPAIIILAEIVTQYRERGNDIRLSYQDIGAKFSLTKLQVKNAIDTLIGIGVIWREFRMVDDEKTGLKLNNVMFVGLELNFQGFTIEHSLVPGQPRTKSGHVYIIEHQGVYKIGIARSVEERMKGIKLPHATQVIHTIATNNMYFAERRLHQRFTSRRLNGEWFQLDHDDLQWLCAIERLDDEVKK